MNTIFCRKLTIALIVTVLGAWQLSANALPKAAEHEDAPVVIVPEVQKPKASSKPAKKEVQKKAPPVAKPKPHKPAHAPKKARTAPAKK